MPLDVLGAASGLDGLIDLCNAMFLVIGQILLISNDEQRNVLQLA